MCVLTEEIIDKEVTVYKVVAVNKRSGNYFSLAMGFRYVNKLIPIIKIQRVLCGFFTDDILDSDGNSYESLMKGRTAAFINIKDAFDLIDSRSYYKRKKHYYTVEVKKAVLSIDLMKGNFWDRPIIAGRKIRFLD